MIQGPKLALPPLQERTMADYLRPLLAAIYPASVEHAPSKMIEKLSHVRTLNEKEPHQRSENEVSSNASG